MDDGQISLAEEHGGIGPHVDNYDVFLIQMEGTRIWQVGKTKMTVEEEGRRLLNGLDVRVLNNWGERNGDSTSKENSHVGEVEELIVYPGDLLYLPPRVGGCCLFV